MITIKEKAIITKEQHKITIDVGDEVPEGEYEILVTMQNVQQAKKPLTFRTCDANIDPSLTFSREEMYDDDGR